MLASFRDALVVAEYQLRRSARSRSALSLLVLYCLLAIGSAVGFIQLLGVLEKEVARTLRVPTTDTPGAMLDAVRADSNFRSMVEAMVGDPALVEWAVGLPYLTVTTFWTVLFLVPFVAAVAGAEVIAPDVDSGAIRFEVVRTGRVEIIVGRYAGRALLLLLSSVIAMLGVVAASQLGMVGVPLWAQTWTLAEVVPRIWCWTFPFLGLGVTMSIVTRNVQIARVLSVVGTSLSWVAWGGVQAGWTEDWGVLTDIVSPLIPQTWMGQLWGPGFGWLVPGLVLSGLGLAMALAGAPLLQRRDL